MIIQTQTLLPQILVLLTALVISKFLEAILKPSLPNPLPALTRTEISPSQLLPRPAEFSTQQLPGYVCEMECAHRRENGTEKQVAPYSIATLLSIIPHREEIFFPLHNFLSS